jgi:TonB family protein
VASTSAPARPKLELNAGAAPRVAPKAQQGDTGLAPDVGAAALNTTNANPATFIELLAAPAPPAPVAEPPKGNLAARVSISPEGKQPVPGGSPKGTVGDAGGLGNDNGKNAMDVSISGGNPPANKGVSSLSGAAKVSPPSPHALITQPNPRATVDDPPVNTAPPNFTVLPPGAKPEQIFSSKKVYKMQVDMPNLNSATGSWILNFAQLRTDSNAPRVTSPDLSGPAPLRKVDPKYPPTLINEHVEGEVVLYAVIRRDGSVDSIQLVRGIDEQLDANAMNAFSQWKFRPAMLQGEPVELEAIVHIPFHAPDLR